MIAWNAETKQLKSHMHTYDKGCLAVKKGDHIKERKSCDMLVILEKLSILMSGTADQYVRFWDVSENNVSSAPVLLMYADHPVEDSLSSIAASADNKYILTGDTSGHLKLWDFSNFKIKAGCGQVDKKMQKWYIKAHKHIINSICVFETDRIEPVVITSSGDHNIHLHLLSKGTFIGQFGQRRHWDIYDLSRYHHARPNKYVPPRAKKKKKVRINVDEGKQSSVMSPGAKSSPGKSMSSTAHKNLALPEGAPPGMTLEEFNAINSEIDESHDEEFKQSQRDLDDNPSSGSDDSYDEDDDADGANNLKNSNKYLKYQPDKSRVNRDNLYEEKIYQNIFNSSQRNEEKVRQIHMQFKQIYEHIQKQKEAAESSYMI